MSAHAFFSPSKSHMWVNCWGAMAMPENQAEGGSSTFADDGTASHEWSAFCLKLGVDAESLLGAKQVINGAEYIMDEDRAYYCQQYIDDVRRRALAGALMVEHKLDLSPYFGEDQFGTSDATILCDGPIEYVQDGKAVATHDLVIIEDLKYGTGEKVYAARNYQGLSYALGAVDDARLAGRTPSHVLIVISQPRLNHLDEWLATIAELEAFAGLARIAIEQAGHAICLPPNDPKLETFLNPGQHTCRWCRAKANCPALAKFVQDEVRQDFDQIQVDVPLIPRDSAQLTRAMNAVPLIQLWCSAVRAEVDKLVREGVQVIGSDGKPYKIVEGDLGDRKWNDESAAEDLLLQQVGAEKAYAPRKILSAAKAAKILDRKATKALWKDVFVPLISRAPGKPVLALGSDDRPPYQGNASADEFELETPTE